MKYTIRDLQERATYENNSGTEIYIIDNHRIALAPIWSYSGGRNERLVTVIVDGNRIATRCERYKGLKKAVAKISEE